ncbi:MAG: hypothetical protein K6V97_03130 [Actinomycetia bacterium]|nr:hypothetical protein [Actinomycetes bacterium]
MTASGPAWLAVADDLTGAAEAAAVWARPGRPVPVAVRPKALDRADRAAGLVVATRTRDADAAGWAARWAAWAEALAGVRPGLAMVKMDSLLRGRWADDVGRLRAVFGPEAVVVAPALPDQDRVVVGGRVRWHGRLLEATEVAGSVPSSRLADYFPDEPAASWTPGAPWPAGAALVLADATSDADLDALVAAAGGARPGLLWVGTRGLIAALARAHGAGGAAPPAVRGRPVLVLVGSRTAMARSQVAALEERYPVLRMAFGEPLGALPPAPVVVVTSQDAAPPPGGAAGVFAGWVEAVRDLLARRAWAALVAAGGETAAAVLEAAGADGVEVVALDREGSVAARIWGGPYAGLPLWTKSGSFGRRETLAALADTVVRAS